MNASKFGDKIMWHGAFMVIWAGLIGAGLLLPKEWIFLVFMAIAALVYSWGRWCDYRARWRAVGREKTRSARFVDAQSLPINPQPVDVAPVPDTISAPLRQASGTAAG